MAHGEGMELGDGRPRVVAVVGASGGCGASTLTAAVCRAAAREGRTVVAVDGQPGGAGLDVVLGLDHVAGVRWPDLARLRGAVDGPDLMLRLPCSDGVAVLAHARDGMPPPGPEVLAAVVVGLAAARRDGGPDLVVVDASRERTMGSDLAWWPCVDLVVVVAGTGVLELAALSSVVAALDGLDADIVLVLRGPRVPGRLCDDVEDSLGLPVLLTVANDPKVARDLGRGVAPGSASGPMARADAAVLTAVGMPVGRSATTSRDAPLGIPPGTPPDRSPVVGRATEDETGRRADRRALWRAS